MKKQITFILLIAFALASCGPSAPDKVQGIPENAFWKGDENTGNWFIIDSVDKFAKTIHCKIYNDKSGKLLVDKKLNLRCYLPDYYKTDIKWDNLKDEFERYDGEVLLLMTKDADAKTCFFK